jgi:hypothetical protein
MNNDFKKHVDEMLKKRTPEEQMRAKARFSQVKALGKKYAEDLSRLALSCLQIYYETAVEDGNIGAFLSSVVEKAFFDGYEARKKEEKKKS